MDSNKMDTLKVCKHHQHERLRQEDDEIWISSEDLRTDGSSDEESHKGHLNKRNKKLIKSEKPSTLPKFQGSTSPGNLTTSERVLLHQTDISISQSHLDVHNPRRLSAHKQHLDIKTDDCAISTAAALNLDSMPSTSGISLGSTDADMDALNLESRWRPKRGSLKYPILVEGETTEHIMHDYESFYTEMMGKLNSMRDIPALDNKYQQDMIDFEIDEDDEKFFRNLKHKPETQEKMRIIEQLDLDIKEKISNYKLERMERLETQNEMCNEICNNNIFPEKDTQLFLDLCNFEVSSSRSENGAQKDPEEEGKADKSNKVSQNKRTQFTNNFVKRNIELAKEGMMAGCSLTDEEKVKLENLLADLEAYECDQADNSEQTRINTEKLFAHLDDNVEEDDSELIRNAYVFSEVEKKKMENIDNQLEKFTLDETEKEKVDAGKPKQRDDDFWKECLLDQYLKKVDTKLETLQKDNEENKRIADEICYKIQNKTSSTTSSNCSETEDTE